MLFGQVQTVPHSVLQQLVIIGEKNPETENLDPISDYAKFCDNVDQHVINLIKELNPTYYFIENPRGGMRKMSWM